MRNLFSLPLGAQCAPFGFNNKCDPFSAIVNGIFGMAQQGSQNAANADQAFQDYLFNLDMWRKQNASQKEQYEKEVEENRYLTELKRQWSLEDRDFENRYNSPSEQIQRLRAAGINPALAMQGQSQYGSVQAQSNIGSGNPSRAWTTPPELHRPSGQAFVGPIADGLGLSANEAANVALQAMKGISDISYANQDMANKTAETIAKIDSMKIDDRYKDTWIQQLKSDMLFNREVWKDKVKMQQNLTALTMYQGYVQQTQAALNQQAYQLNIDANNRAWQQLSGYLSSVASQNALNKVLGEKAFAETTGISWDNVKKEFDNNPLRLQQIYKENREYWDDILAKMRFERNFAGMTKFIESVSALIPFAPGIKSIQNMPLQ